MSHGERQELQKTLNMKDVLALAFGTMIGWGWIMLAGTWVGNGGVAGAILAFAFGGVMALFVGLTYAELTPALPLAGGELVFSYRAMGYNASWFTGWMITLAYIGVAAWEGPALSNALGFLFGSLLPDLGVLYEIQGSEVTGMFLLIGALGWFVNAAAFGTVVAYFMVSLSYCILRSKEPNLARPFKVKGGGIVGIIAVLVSLFFCSLYLPIYSPTPLAPIEWVS